MLRTKFILGPSTVDVVKINDDTSVDELPARIYTLCHGEFRGYYLTIAKDQLMLPSKIYGNAMMRVNKCIASYVDRPMSTGILMTGDKGTGKTLLMSLLANQVVKELALPVILVREPYEGDEFMTFIEMIGECCLVFDEFGKMYSSNHREDGPNQESLLSLMDGIDKTKRLFIMAENDEYDISEFLYNRPGRVYYHFRYKKLDEDSIKDFCKDHNIKNEIIHDIIELSRRSRIFSFDMLQSIVEEHLRFNYSINNVIEDLNIDISQESEVKIEILKVININTNVEYQLSKKQSRIVNKPIYDYEYISYVVPKESEKVKGTGNVPSLHTSSESNKTQSFHIDHNTLKYESMGNLVYESEDIRVIAKEIPAYQFRYEHLF